MNDFTVRISTTTDDEVVSALLQASYPMLMKSSYDSAMLSQALELMTKANPVLLASGTYYISESLDGSVVGCGGWTKERPGDGMIESELGHIRHFGTHPDWLKRGIGRAIYLRCEADARRAGINRFQCYSSLNAEGFYSALGFKSIRRINIELAHDILIPALLMSREI